ncbi:MAG TPA: potassium channel family protein [Gallionella sp.]|nr:potassium channel family protein [Gallionella sp.]
MRIIHLLGIAGVDPQEQPAARQWAKLLEWPMLAVALWIPIQWYLEEAQLISPLLANIANWLVWLAFLVETVVLTALVKNKQHYLLHNWLNLAIIVGGLPLIWQYTPLIGLMRSLRLLLVVALLARLSRTTRKLLSRHQLGATLAVALITMLLSGVIITRLDPSIGNVWDGMWWAWISMSTVGYGDVVPHNAAGRLFGALLILFGVVVISMLTASLSAFFIGGDVEKVEHEEREADRMLKDISERLERVERLLEQQLATKDQRHDDRNIPG